MSQIQKKFIGDNQVDGAKIRLLNGQALRARNAAGTSDIDILRIASNDHLEILTLPEALATLPIPSAPKQFATIEYIQNYIAGKSDAKDAVHALADSPMTLTGSAPLIVDGYDFGSTTSTPVKRIALVGQTSAAENGIYDYIVTGANYTLTRSSDFDQGSAEGEVTSGSYFLVINGTIYSGYEVLLTTPDPIVIGTTDLIFAKYPSTLSLTGGDMIVKTGNSFAVDLAVLSGLESTNPGQDNGQLRVKTDTASLEKDQTTRRDPSTGAVVAKRSRKVRIALTSTDISNQYIDLDSVAEQDSVNFSVLGAGSQEEDVDYSVNYTGGSSSKTRVTFLNGLAAGGVSALVSGDTVVVKFRSF